MRHANSTVSFRRRGIFVSVATVLIAILALSHAAGATAQEDEGRSLACSNATLRGDYGILVSGIRQVGPGATEMFISVALRTGNTPEPDSTWSDWMPEQTEAQQASITAPAARFLQYRVTLTTDDAQKTPALHSIALRYMTTNQAPELASLTVPDLDAANLDNPKKLRFKWSATDANEDELIYNLYVRKDGWKNWVLLEEDLEHTDFEWDTTTTPSGMYRLKVVASDRKDNPPEAALTGQRISNSFAVAHEAPTVTLKTAGMDGDQAIIEATATDPLVRLTSASYSVNGKKWVNVFPTDGLFDSKMESFRFKTNALKPGTYVVVLRAKDAAGNTGSGDLVFTVSSKDKP